MLDHENRAELHRAVRKAYAITKDQEEFGQPLGEVLVHLAKRLVLRPVKLAYPHVAAFLRSRVVIIQTQ